MYGRHSALEFHDPSIEFRPRILAEKSMTWHRTFYLSNMFILKTADVYMSDLLF